MNKQHHLADASVVIPKSIIEAYAEHYITCISDSWSDSGNPFSPGMAMECEYVLRNIMKIPDERIKDLMEKGMKNAKINKGD